ncbi:translocation/assembly module TamB domain-containing protein [Legionella quateirensis]|uniref:Periplasmic protein n=1 Tax=Legionella quateirensis TaxID=45072 RepID=A0A378KSL6_9GAMM|nr:translocation/assembly module TamB domain-containing protein [Legionella quateirensis]KTD51214.1 periplasmic protein [Legionella quateirensis]STY17542.1 periplasmic protein [Legionella quateirensis]
MMKLLKKLFYFSLVLLICLIALLSFFLSTTPGLYTLVRLSTVYLPGTIKVHHIQGRLLDQFSIDTLDYQHNTTHIEINQLQVKWSLNSLMHPQLQFKELNAKSIELNEQIAIQKFSFTGSITRNNLKVDSLRFKYLKDTISGRMQVDFQRPHALTGSIRLNPKNPTQSLLKGTLNFGGDLNQLRWTGDVQGPAVVSVNGSLNNLSEFEQMIKWRDGSWPLSEQNRVYSPEGRLKISGTFPELNIEIKTKVNQNHKDNLQINASIHGTLPQKWNFNATVTNTQPPESTTEGIYSSLNIRGELQDLNKGFVNLTLAPGHYQMAKDSSLPILQFSGGTVKALLTPKALSGKGSLKIDSNTQMNLNFNLPDFKLSNGFSGIQPISAELTLLVNSFDFVKSFSPDISNPQGHLTASLMAKGTLNKLLFESKLRLAKASVSIPKLGLYLNAIDITALAKKKKWEANGTISASNKKLLVKGQGSLDTTRVSELTLEGADFPIVNTKEYQINISPQLKLSITPSNLTIAGTVVIPYAQIKPQSFSNSLTVSEDVIFKTKQEEKPPAPLNTNVDIKVEMGEKVELTFKGLHATLAGAVNLKQQPQGPMNAIGELNVVQGEYKAYGQDLAIEQGELIFTGGRLDNPGINLRASKKIDTTSTSLTSSNQLFDFNNNNLQNANLRGNIRVGVEVTGRLSTPKIQLFSTPSILSQADILSMLVLGRPASQANKAGGQLLLAAISSMNLGTGTNGAQLLDQLKQNLGFDLNVQTNSNFNLVTNQVSDNTALVVGKSLSKRMYLSYNVGLSQADPNVLTLKYLLNKFLSIQVSSSDAGSGIDILYTSNK